MKVKDFDEIIFFGSVVPDLLEFRTAAFSRAGNMAQTSIIEGLIEQDMPITRVFSFLPQPVFPRSKNIFSKGESVNLVRSKITLIPYINIPYIKYFSIATMLLLYTIFNTSRKKKSLIITYNFSSYLAIPALVMRMIRKIEIIPILYDVNIPGETIKKTLLSKTDFHFTKHVLRYCSAAIVITENVATDLMYGKPYIVIEGGLSQSQENYGKSFTINEKKSQLFVIVFAGAIEYYNGIDVILDAFSITENSNIRLKIAGKGTLTDLVKNRAEKDYRIEYHNYLNVEELVKLYENASLLINHRSDHRINSRYVFPSKLIEYLSTGIPTISTDFASLRSEYKPYLLLLADEDPGTLALAIKEVAENMSYFKERANNGQKFIIREKTWKVQTKKIKDFLLKMKI